MIIRKKDILALGKGPTKGLEQTLTAEKMYHINFAVTKHKFCLILHCNGANSYCLPMVQKFTNLRQKILKLQQVHYAKETFQKTGQHIIWKKTGFNGYAYDFCVD